MSLLTRHLAEAYPTQLPSPVIRHPWPCLNKEFAQTKTWIAGNSSLPLTTRNNAILTQECQTLKSRCSVAAKEKHGLHRIKTTGTKYTSITTPSIRDCTSPSGLAQSITGRQWPPSREQATLRATASIGQPKHLQMSKGHRSMRLPRHLAPRGGHKEVPIPTSTVKTLVIAREREA